MRILVAVCLCLTFQGVQQHVLRSDRDAAIQTASNQRDGTPDHDWRRAGDGTTRALQTHLSPDRTGAPAGVFNDAASAPAGVAREPVAASFAGAYRSPIPLRI